MRYILDQKEYDDLVSLRDDRIHEADEILQDLCTKVAVHMPSIKVDGKPDLVPHGCILTKPTRLDYCDHCPVQDVCPNPYKSWSY